MRTSTPTPEDASIGSQAIAAGKVGCIVLAGGDGTRLGWSGPKGTYPLNSEGLTLFCLLEQKVEKARAHFKKNLPIAVMVSPSNEEAIREALPSRFELFEQGVLPLLDDEKRPLPEMRPNGNGDVLKNFFNSGLYTKWKEAGVEYLQVIPVDNPLAEPFDPAQIGLHMRTGADVTLKVVEKQKPDEKVGVVGERDGKVVIVEYNDNPPKEWNLANTGLFTFSMGFVEKTKDHFLPQHLAAKIYDSRSVYKQETYIFDLLTYAEKVELLLCERGKTFAPLKTREDVKSCKVELIIS